MIPRVWFRLLFLAYAILVATATHWPHLKVEGPVYRSDLWIHFAAFSVWTVLAALAAWFGQALSKRNLTRTFVLAAVYTLIDEVTQGIPGLGRMVDPTDIAANLLGVCIGMALLVAGRRMAMRLVLGDPTR